MVQIVLGHQVGVGVIVGEGLVLVGSGDPIDAEAVGGRVEGAEGVPQPCRLHQQLEAHLLLERAVPGGLDNAHLFFAPRDPGPLPGELAERHERQSHLQAAAAALSNRYRLIVSLRSFAAWSFREIALVLDIPESTAKTRYQRAKRSLRATLSAVSN